MKYFLLIYTLSTGNLTTIEMQDEFTCKATAAQLHFSYKTEILMAKCVVRGTV